MRAYKFRPFTESGAGEAVTLPKSSSKKTSSSSVKPSSWNCDGEIVREADLDVRCVSHYSMDHDIVDNYQP